jgi:hypothetical protein
MEGKKIFKKLQSFPASSQDHLDARDEGADLAFACTFDRGINPESVEKMKEALQKAEKLIEKLWQDAVIDRGLDILTIGDHETRDEIKEALTAAKLT